MPALAIDRGPRPLGRSGLSAFPLAYGCWRFAGTAVREAREKIEAALEIGVDLFDHADIYGGEGAAEALFGRVLAEAPALRERMNIATKCGIVPGVPYDSSAAHIAHSAEASLARLGIDCIDVYQIHRPDWLGHPEVVAGALAALREAGKIREVGVSNHSASHFDALQTYLPFPIATHQPEFSCWHLAPLENGVLDQCLRERVAPLAWSPLARGSLGLGVVEARREPYGERLAALIETLDKLAQREGVARGAVALAWLLAHPAGVIPILGTQRPERIREAARAFDVQLSREDWYAVVTASRGEPLP